MMAKRKLPNTFVLLFAILAVIAGATWLIPGGKYETHLVNGRTLIDPASFHAVPSSPQGPVALLMAPLKGFVDAALIIGFVLLLGGAFGVLLRTQAVDALIKAIAKAHTGSRLVRAALIPGFMTLFSLGGATFGMSEEAIPFVLIFVPLALALGYDSIVGVAIPFVGSQVGFAAAFLNPFNVGVAQGIAGVQVFSGIGYRMIVWAAATAVTIGFMMIYAAKVKRSPESSPTFALDRHKRLEHANAPGLDDFRGMTRAQGAVLIIFLGALASMVFGVVRYQWFIEEIAVVFLVMTLAVAKVTGLSADELVAAFIHGAKDMVSTALVISLARGTVILARDAHIIDTMLHALTPLVRASHPVLAAQKMLVIQSVINFFIHSGTGQAALTMPVMAPLADLVGVSRQTAVLAFQLGELGITIIPTSGVTIGVLALAGIPWATWAKWILPLQLLYFVLAAILLIPPHFIDWQ